MALKAIIFDLNGIFFISEKLSERFQRDFHVPVSEFLPVLSTIMDLVRQPNAQPAFVYWQPHLVKWGITLTEPEFWDYWFKAEKPSEEMLTLSKELKADGLKVFILSNNFKERAAYYGNYPWLKDVVDKVYYSWETGFIKPDPQAWLYILEENNLAPEECLYFDDQEKNVHAAEGLGIKAYLFSNIEVTRHVINKTINI